MDKSSLFPYEPETLPFSSLLLKAWTILRNHAKFLLRAAFLLMALPLLMSLSVVALSGAQQRGEDPAEAQKLPPTLAVLLVLILLMSAAAEVALIAVIVHVVITDHLGMTPQNLLWAVKRSFWRLASTYAAKVGVICGLLLVANLTGGVFIALLVATGNTDGYAILVAYVLLVLVTTPAVIYTSLNLTLAGSAAVIEGTGMWGFKALCRSWTLCKGNRWTVFKLVCLAAVGTLVLVVPLDMLALNVLASSAPHGQHGGGHVLARGALLVPALAIAALVICLVTYFKVAWVLVYLSARKKLEPSFGLSTLELYFDAGSLKQAGYVPIGHPLEDV